MLIKPQSFSDYIKLQLNARLVISDSGTINEESSILNFPAINIRDTHERPEAMEETAVMMTGVNSKRVTQAIDIIMNSESSKDTMLNLVDDYKSKNKDDIPYFEDIKEIKRITPKQGRVVVFDGAHWHTAEQPRKNKRCIINFNVNK